MIVEESRITLRLQNVRVTLAYPNEMADEIEPFFDHFQRTGHDELAGKIFLRLGAGGAFDLFYEEDMIWSGLQWPHALQVICDEIERIFVTGLPDVVLRTGAVRHAGKSVLILGPAGSRKSELTAWFVSRGFQYLADNFVGLATNQAFNANQWHMISPLALPIALHAAARAVVIGFPALHRTLAVTTEDRLTLKPAIPSDHGALQHCGLIVVPKFHEGASPAIEILRPDEARFLLAQAAHPERPLESWATLRLAQFSERVPAIAIRYGDYDQLADTLDSFVRHVLESNMGVAAMWDLLDQWRRPPVWTTLLPTRPAGPKARRSADTASHRLPEAPFEVDHFAPIVPVQGEPSRKRLTIGIAAYDDFDGVYFTVQSIRLYHADMIDEIEFIIVDNNPDGLSAPSLMALGKWIKHFRYVPVRERMGTAVRGLIMELASSDYVLCLDSHVMLPAGVLAGLAEYFEANPETDDLLQGPLLYDDLGTIATHLEPVWHRGLYGKLALDERGLDPDARPFEIHAHRMGLFACRRAAWPGFNPAFRGLGGEEGYIHEKFRQAGGRTLCLPFLRWVHRFGRPFGRPYPFSWENLARNYLIGWDELGLPLAPVFRYFRQFLREDADDAYKRIRRELAQLRKQRRKAKLAK